MAAAATSAAVKAGMSAASKLSKLRQAFASAGVGGAPIHAFVVPTDDAHSSEYVADHDKRREWLSHFTGSAGTAVVTESEAKLWTDGRYFAQAVRELPEGWALMKDRLPETPSVDAWLAKVLKPGSAVGVDPTTVSAGTAQAWEATLAAAGITLMPVAQNPIDSLWGSDTPSQPPTPSAGVRVHPVALSGQTAPAKLQAVREAALDAGVHAVVVSALDDVAWLLNIRGGDIAFNPVVQAYVLVTQGAVQLFLDDSKLTPAVRAYLTGEGYSPPAQTDEGALRSLQGGPDGSALLTTADESPQVTLHPYTDIVDAVAAAGAQGKVLLDSASANYALLNALQPEARHVTSSPVRLPKALKNATELAGFRACHLRDGTALTQWLAWLQGQMEAVAKTAAAAVESGANPAEAYSTASAEAGLTEATVADKLQSFREAVPGFVSLSFDTISGSAGNGAIIHYHATPDIAKPVRADSMYLVDSGAQYLDGTTDVTRTVHFGEPSEWEKECFTRVLRAHIAMDTAVFPVGWSGGAIDGITRQPLWEGGLEYLHGTGHGVGHFLNVHEGPQSVSFRPNAYKGGLQLGMTITDEPGYYEEGAFGIRIENVCVVVQAAKDIKPRGQGATFEHITCAPITPKLVNVDLLSDKELGWLNAYNAWVKAMLTPRLEAAGDAAALAYLEAETRPVARADGSTGRYIPAAKVPAGAGTMAAAPGTHA